MRLLGSVLFSCRSHAHATGPARLTLRASKVTGGDRRRFPPCAADIAREAQNAVEMRASVKQLKQ